MPCRGIKKPRNGVCRNSACRRLFKTDGVQPVVDLFASSRTFQVEKYYSTDLTDKRARSGATGPGRHWPPGLRYAFPPPPMIQLTLGQLKKMGGELILITPYWPDQCWFPEVMTAGRHIPKALQATQVVANERDDRANRFRR